MRENSCSTKWAAPSATTHRSPPPTTRLWSLPAQQSDSSLLNFLLHNMGLASDFIAQAGAGQYEMRTPPLWGLRTRRPMWHDGRISEGTFSDLVTDAIAEHNALLSEGVASAQAYDALPSQDKADVIAFLGSLGRAEFDMNGDESVDLFDLPSVTACFNGDGTDQYDADSPCAVADIDQDGDVDETDANWFAQALGHLRHRRL